MRIEYAAPQHVRDLIGALAQTEDVKFSPNNRRLAIAGFRKHKILVCDISIGVSPDGPTIALTDAAEIFSTHLNRPHGLDFIDDETIIVANRRGDVPILKLPPGGLRSARYNLEPLDVIGPDGCLHGPSCISVRRKDHNLYEVLIGNNHGNSVTRHVLDFNSGYSVRSNEVLVKKGLDSPDGICASRQMEWIAVSNFEMHSVFLYKNIPSLNEGSDPDGVLRRVFYPHGLAFTPDGRYILVADAGAPYVHIYEKDGPSWRGLRNPINSIRVLDEEMFLLGRYNPREGGPKGLAINNDMNILMTTNKFQPLAFFDLAKILEGTPSQRQEFGHPNNYGEKPCTEPTLGLCVDQKTSELRYEIDVLLDIQNKVNQAKAKGEADLARLTNSIFWRITAPLRWIASFLSNLPRR